MIFRTIGITILKWLTVYLVIALLYIAIPVSLGSTIPLIAAWIVAFMIAWLYAMWAFHPNIPDRKTIWTVFGIWMGVTLTAYLLYVFRVSLLGLSGLLSYQLIVQIVLEAFAIHLAAFTRKGRMLKQELGE